MEVVIIRLTPYREKDYIVNALSSEGIISFRAPGALRLNSKLAGSLTLYNLVDIEVQTGKAGFVLSGIKALSASHKIYLDTNKLVALNVIGEISQKLLIDDDSVRETFILLKEVLLNLPECNYNLSLIYLYITNLLSLLGVKLVTEGCVHCHKRVNIVGLDLSAGGFVCSTHAGAHTIYMGVHEINIIRYGFMIDHTKLVNHEFKDEEVSKVLKLMLTYIEDVYAIKLVSSELLF